jgi:hypothetical protein
VRLASLSGWVQDDSTSKRIKQMYFDCLISPNNRLPVDLLITNVSFRLI